MISAGNRFAEGVRAIAPLTAIAGAIALLLRFPPEQYSFYPQCPIYALFHIQCPGCGTTRALAALLHGHVMEALRLNALTTLASPFVMVYAGVCYRHYLRRDTLRLPQIPVAGIYVGLAVAMLFMLLRNLPLQAL